MKFLLALILLVVVAIVATGVFVWSGSYNIAADVPHWSITESVLHTLRERSIETRIDGIEVPSLDDPGMIAEGAEHYAGMCTGCHLSPDRSESEIRPGLYPHPPNLTRFAPDPAEAFWVIKHGIKMSGMPAWGGNHTDEQIWAMVAFLQQQPDMSVARYRELTTPDMPAAMPAEVPAEMHEHEHDTNAAPVPVPKDT